MPLRLIAVVANNILQRHVLVKGCGKAQAAADVKEINEDEASLKSESVDHSPVAITASA